MTKVVINLESRQARGYLDQINKALRRHEVPPDSVFALHNAGELTKTLANLKDSERVIVGGGDGSILTAINAFARTETALGVLPLGTANNFAQVLGLADEPLTTLSRLLASRQTRTVNLGKANDTYFSSMATVGVSAALNKEIDNKLKSRLGTGAYAIEGVRQLANHKPFFAHVVIDGRKESFETHEIIVANTALNLPFNLNIDFELERDELLIVSLSKTASRIKQLRGLFKLMNKISDEDMLVETGREIAVMTEPSHRPFECDGEHIGETPIKITLEKQALTIIAPAAKAP